MSRKKAVINAEPEALADVEALVREGRFASVSEFVREAMREKLARLRRERLHRQVASYCREVDIDEGDNLIAAQAFLTDEDS